MRERVGCESGRESERERVLREREWVGWGVREGESVV